MARGVQVVIDCAEPSNLGKFWATALDYVEQPPPEGFDSWEGFLTSIGVPEDEWDTGYAVVDPDGVGPRIYFQKVPEKKQVKNRVHLDLDYGGGRSVPLEERKDRIRAAADRLAGEGASVVGPVEEEDSFWIVMQDPEGNEFCIH